MSRIRRLVALLAATIVLAVLAEAVAEGGRKDEIHDRGRLAGAAGRWDEASLRFRELLRLDPADRDVEARFAESADRDMVLVPAGWFVMGSTEGDQDERPRRLVYLDAFRIDRHEVSNAQYRRFLVANGRSAPRYWSGADYPVGRGDVAVVGVGWADACAYCDWAGKRLPTEAEWEKACRGTDGRTYPWGEVWDPSRADVGSRPMHLDDAWPLLEAHPSDPTGPRLDSVGSNPQGASPYGVMDLVGGVSEWLADWFDWDGYWDWPVRNPVGEGPPQNRSVRGSAWLDPHGLPGWLADVSRCANRTSSHSYDDPRVGFRCAASAPREGTE